MPMKSRVVAIPLSDQEMDELGLTHLSTRQQGERVAELLAQRLGWKLSRGELIEQIDRHLRQMSPHVRERRTAHLLMLAVAALRLESGGGCVVEDDPVNDEATA